MDLPFEFFSMASKLFSSIRQLVSFEVVMLKADFEFEVVDLQFAESVVQHHRFYRRDYYESISDLKHEFLFYLEDGEIFARILAKFLTTFRSQKSFAEFPLALSNKVQIDKNQNQLFTVSDVTPIKGTPAGTINLKF